MSVVCRPLVDRMLGYETVANKAHAARPVESSERGRARARGRARGMGGGMHGGREGGGEREGGMLEARDPKIAVSIRNPKP